MLLTALYNKIIWDLLHLFFKYIKLINVCFNCRIHLYKNVHFVVLTDHAITLNHTRTTKPSKVGQDD